MMGEVGMIIEKVRGWWGEDYESILCEEDHYRTSYRHKEPEL